MSFLPTFTCMNHSLTKQDIKKEKQKKARSPPHTKVNHTIKDNTGEKKWKGYKRSREYK